MNRIFYVKIQNFKLFGEEIQINLENPSILIGANNSGKTSVIQALALWSWAVRLWYEKKHKTKSQSQRRKGVALNRLEIAQVPIKESRYFWNNTEIRHGSNENIPLKIIVGLGYKGTIKDVGMSFTYHSQDLIYCQPTEESFHDGNLELIQYAAELPIHLLYPMSGMSDKEFVLQEEAIRTQIGTGQTANVLRNICYQLYNNSKEDWEYLYNLMKKLFSVSLSEPFVRATGVIEFLYNYETKVKTKKDLDITLAGRGQQQMLLVLAYLLSNKGSVLMIDEPDAHLEILRQAQIYRVLKETAENYNCQIIIVTHSEVVLNEANNVIFIADGQAQEISDKQEHKYIKDALRSFGIEHYYKAKLKPNILYVESSTDLNILKKFAQKFNHPVSKILEDKINFYYTKNEESQTNLTKEIEQIAGAYQPFKRHFQAIKKVVPLLNGIAIFDSDNQNRQDEQNNDFGLFYWKRYEIENYFITPKVVFQFVEKELKNSRIEGIFLQERLDKYMQIFDKEFLLPIFNNNQKALEEFKNLPANMQAVQFENFASTKKVSELLENTFRAFSEQCQEPILLTKGNFYQLIDYLETLPEEVKEKLDLVQEYLSSTGDEPKT